MTNSDSLSVIVPPSHEVFSLIHVIVLKVNLSISAESAVPSITFFIKSLSSVIPALAKCEWDLEESFAFIFCIKADMPAERLTSCSLEGEKSSLLLLIAVIAFFVQVVSPRDVSSPVRVMI